MLTRLALATVALLALGAARPQAQCVSADSNAVYTGVTGDFELLADPSDPAGNLIIIANTADGPSTVSAAQIDGTTGSIKAGSLVAIASNFNGQAKINGPEFVLTPAGSLGVLYAGGDGVHGVFRQATPPVWSQFDRDVSGAPITGTAGPLLPNSAASAYPSFEYPGLLTYLQYQGSCTSLCAASLGAGKNTDLGATIKTVAGVTAVNAALSPRDGYVFISGTDASNSSGVWEAKIDGNGGFAVGSLQRVLTAGAKAITAIKHPVTGSTVVFVKTSGSHIAVYEQPAAGGQLTQLAMPAISGASHFTAYRDNTQALLHFYAGPLIGASASYTLSVTANGSTLVVGQPKNQSTHSNGAEVRWMPAIDKWQLFFRDGSNVINRCPITP